jgi:hypothetical protein
MTEPTDEERERPPQRIVVPGRARRPDDLADDELLILALLVCVFLTWAFFIK